MKNTPFRIMAAVLILAGNLESQPREKGTAADNQKKQKTEQNRYPPAPAPVQPIGRPVSNTEGLTHRTGGGAGKARAGLTLFETNGEANWWVPPGVNPLLPGVLSENPGIVQVSMWQLSSESAQSGYTGSSFALFAQGKTPPSDDQLNVANSVDPETRAKSFWLKRPGAESLTIVRYSNSGDTIEAGKLVIWHTSPELFLNNGEFDVTLTENGTRAKVYAIARLEGQTAAGESVTQPLSLHSGSGEGANRVVALIDVSAAADVNLPSIHFEQSRDGCPQLCEVRFPKNGPNLPWMFSPTRPAQEH